MILVTVDGLKIRDFSSNMDILPVFLKVYRPKFHIGLRPAGQEPILSVNFHKYRQNSHIGSRALCKYLMYTTKVYLKVNRQYSCYFGLQNTLFCMQTKILYVVAFESIWTKILYLVPFKRIWTKILYSVPFNQNSWKIGDFGQSVRQVQGNMCTKFGKNILKTEQIIPLLHFSTNK